MHSTGIKTNVFSTQYTEAATKRPEICRAQSTLFYIHMVLLFYSHELQNTHTTRHSKINHMTA
jgi:hypothetical protein